ncbi:MAG: hypothetical protein IPH50_03320 [Rhodanobacteraceae bacterium]|nr:hypothetical protein [Rhodanobacteraceae bacterium]
MTSPTGLDVIVLHREPILDRVPNLKHLIEWLAARGHRIHVLTTRNRIFPPAHFSNPNVEMHVLPERSRRWELPTLSRFVLRCSELIRSARRADRPTTLIIAGRGALSISPIVSVLHGGRYFAHVVEYPAICEPAPYRPKLSDRLEARAIRNSVAMIVHDDLHARVITAAIENAPNYLTLPNASPGAFDGESGYQLHTRLQLPPLTKILLHSGGFGEWFSSADVASVSSKLPDGYRLVFHVSHDITGDGYYLRYMKNRGAEDNSIFSLNPVDGQLLNRLVGSAHVGLAWYNPNRLSFRARMMGLAAGKIGQYLKCGLPVIASRLPSLRYLEDHQAGVLVDSAAEIPDALSNIERDYARYRDNAFRCYQSLWEPTQCLLRIERALTTVALR